MWTRTGTMPVRQVEVDEDGGDADGEAAEDKGLLAPPVPLPSASVSPEPLPAPRSPPWRLANAALFVSSAALTPAPDASPDAPSRRRRLWLRWRALILCLLSHVLFGMYPVLGRLLTVPPVQLVRTG
jgi:hypothetical protein